MCLLYCFPENPCVSPGPRCSILLCVWLSRRVRARFVVSLFFSGRSWVLMEFSDTSSDELEEHNAWNPMLELFLNAHIGDIHGSIGR